MNLSTRKRYVFLLGQALGPFFTEQPPANSPGLRVKTHPKASKSPVCRCPNRWHAPSRALLAPPKPGSGSHRLEGVTAALWHDYSRWYDRPQYIPPSSPRYTLVPELAKWHEGCTCKPPPGYGQHALNALAHREESIGYFCFRIRPPSTEEAPRSRLPPTAQNG